MLMGMTETEKILAKASGRNFVKPDEIVEVAVDRAMIHDNNAALTIKNFNLINSAKVWDPERVVFFIDHHSPSTTVKAAKHHKTMRSFAREHAISRLHECGCGISHVVMLEEGLAGRGDVVVGTDSHTTGEGALGAFATGIGSTEMAAVLAKGTIWMKVPKTISVNASGQLPFGTMPRDLINVILGHFGPDGANYCAVEFSGEIFDNFSLDDKIMSCVMSMEMGAKNAMVVEEGTSDSAAEYMLSQDFMANEIVPTVAVPSLPTNVEAASLVERDKIKINQAAIASCAGALLSDIAMAAKIIKGRSVAKGVRFLVIPATRTIFNQAMALGYIQKLSEAGAVISSPCCGACGAHDSGVLAEGETCISSSTRNMKGRMGAGGIVYLGSSATVAASAVTGYITDPRELLADSEKR